MAIRIPGLTKTIESKWDRAGLIILLLALPLVAYPSGDKISETCRKNAARLMVDVDGWISVRLHCSREEQKIMLRKWREDDGSASLDIQRSLALTDRLDSLDASARAEALKLVWSQSERAKKDRRDRARELRLQLEESNGT